MNDQPTACPFCHKKVLTKRGLRQHINQSLRCSKKELEDLQKDDRGHETAFDYMEMDNGPTSSTKRVRYCGNVRYKLGKTTGHAAEIPEHVDIEDIDSENDFAIAGGNNSDVSDSEQLDQTSNSTQPLSTIRNKFLK